MSAEISAGTRRRFSPATWLDDRTGLSGLMRRILDGRVERSGAWLRTTGMACLVLLVVECVTGPILGLYYAPAPGDAYSSILTIEANPMGRFLRGIHHWSSAALILLSGLTLVRMFFGGEYRNRRDLVWIGVLLFSQFALLFQLTGHILPWDTNAAATADVEAGIGGNVWVVGPAIKRFLLGGGGVSGATLARWYGFHALLLPLALLLIVGIPLFANRLRTAEDGLPNDPATQRPSDPYYPTHMAREMVVALAVFLIVAGMAWFAKTPLEKQATAVNLQGYKAMSEWYVLPLHAATLIPPFNSAALEPIVTFVLPGLLVLALLLLPFLDRGLGLPLARRPAGLAAGILVLCATTALALFAVVKERPAAQVENTSPGPLHVQPAAAVDTQLVAMGKQLYAKQGCNACHSIAGKGGKVGPDLTKAGTLHPDRDWQIAHLIQPTSKVPGSTMPAYGTLKENELKALAEYLVSLR